MKTPKIHADFNRFFGVRIGFRRPACVAKSALR
jgi:hypothetical protein